MARRSPRAIPRGWERLPNRHYRNKRSGENISYYEYRQRFILHAKPTRRPPSPAAGPWQSRGDRKTRQYVNQETGEVISRRKYDQLFGRNADKALHGRWHRVCATTLSGLLGYVRTLVRSNPKGIGFIVVTGEVIGAYYADEDSGGEVHPAVWRTVSHGQTRLDTLMRSELTLRLRQEELVRNPKSWCLLWQ